MVIDIEVLATLLVGCVVHIFSTIEVVSDAVVWTWSIDVVDSITAEERIDLLSLVFATANVVAIGVDSKAVLSSAAEVGSEVLSLSDSVVVHRIVVCAISVVLSRVVALNGVVSSPNELVEPAVESS